LTDSQLIYCKKPKRTSIKFVLLFGLKLSLQPNIGFTLRRFLTVFTRSAITRPKVNRLGRNMERSEYIVGGCSWQILGAIRTVERDSKANFCQVSNAPFHRSPVGKISWNLHATRRSVSRWKRLEQNFEKFPVRGRFSKNAKFSQKFHRRKLTANITLYEMSSIHFYCWNQLKPGLAVSVEVMPIRHTFSATVESHVCYID